MDVQRAQRVTCARPLIALGALCAATALFSPTAPSAAADTFQNRAATTAGESFDQLYERGQGINASLRTLTARFTETTTSTLLVRPLIARGTLAVERPTRVVLRYVEPEPRVILIADNKMTVTWPTRQTIDVGATMKRVQKYFVEASAVELRRQFDIDDRQTGERPGAYRLLMTPKQKRIRETLEKLELWIDRDSSLLSSMRMTFANGDTKTMTFEQVVPNTTLPTGTFSIE
jgi:outer membrane lipoprotein-sorting protein